LSIFFFKIIIAAGLPSVPSLDYGGKILAEGGLSGYLSSSAARDGKTYLYVQANTRD